MAAKFEKFLIPPDFQINFRKINQISKNYLKHSKSYGQKPLGVSKDPPGLNRVNNKSLFKTGKLNTSLRSCVI